MPRSSTRPAIPAAKLSSALSDSDPAGPKTAATGQLDMILRPRKGDEKLKRAIRLASEIPSARGRQFRKGDLHDPGNRSRSFEGPLEDIPRQIRNPGWPRRQSRA